MYLRPRDGSGWAVQERGGRNGGVGPSERQKDRPVSLTRRHPPQQHTRVRTQPEPLRVGPMRAAIGQAASAIGID